MGVVAVVLSGLLLSANAFAASSSACESPQKDTFVLADFVTLLRNEACHVKNINQALALLPERMRSRPVLFYRSKSLQGPHKLDYLYPRAILSSFRSTSFSPMPTIEPGMMLSFNGHASQPGYNRLEIVDIDPTPGSSSVFNYHEIQFPDEFRAKTLTWQQVQAEISVSPANPAKCVQCHGMPARPIYQQYPSWEGAFGSVRFGPLPSTEKQGLAAFVAKHANDSNSRYRLLNPARFTENDSSSSVQKGINDSIGFANAQQTNRMNIELSNLNAIRVARLIRTTPFYEAMKFAVAGAMFECSHPRSFFTPEVLNALEMNIDSIHHYSQPAEQQRSEQRFLKLMPLEVRGGTGSHGSFRRDHECMPVECLANHKVFWESDPVLMGLAVDAMEKQGYDRMAPQVAFQRLIFEGHGVPLNNWWADLRQPTYRTNSGDALPWNIALQNQDPTIPPLPPVMSDVARESYCSTLSEQSRKAMNGYKVPTVQAPPGPPAETFPSVFAQTCAKCHVDEEIGPRIPFKNPAALEAWVRNRENMQRIQFRVFEADETQSMPPTRALTEDELRQINSYLDQFK